ncbi:MAG: hypothetical protein RML40_05860 [Bacteroidota bacterium]|nr:hypothetical protein [Candidatus Kapabacteria bacterium]MDW8220039.1 hypothetical protein [Bacteroidota bacterium]
MPVVYRGVAAGEQESIISLCCTPEEIFGILTAHGRTYNLVKIPEDFSVLKNIYAII